MYEAIDVPIGQELNAGNTELFFAAPPGDAENRTTGRID
jgi:hypothetical protein